MSENPEVLRRPEAAPRASGGNTSGLIGLARMALPALAVGLALYMLILPGVYVSQVADKKNHDSLVQLVNTKADATQLKGDEGTLSTLATQITGLSKQVQDSQSSVSSMSSTVSKISGIQSGLDSLTAKVNGLPTQPDLSPLKTQLASLQADVTSLKTDIASLKADVAALKSPTVPVSSPPTIVSFTPATGTTGTPVVITGTNLNGATAVTFGGAAATFVINSGTSITATVGTGATGVVSVTTPAGATATTTSFTYTASTTPIAGTVTTAFSTTPIILIKQADNITYANNFNLTITNGLAKDIFNGQLSLTVQYIGAMTPTADGAGTLTVGGVAWQAPTVGTVSFTEVSDPTLYINANSPMTLTINFKIVPVTPFTATQYIRINAASYTGYMQ